MNVELEEDIQEHEELVARFQAEGVELCLLTTQTGVFDQHLDFYRSMNLITRGNLGPTPKSGFPQTELILIPSWRY